MQVLHKWERAQTSIRSGLSCLGKVGPGAGRRLLSKYLWRTTSSKPQRWIDTQGSHVVAGAGADSAAVAA